MFRKLFKKKIRREKERVRKKSTNNLNKLTTRGGKNVLTKRDQITKLLEMKVCKLPFEEGFTIVAALTIIIIVDHIVTVIVIVVLRLLSSFLR